MANETPITVTGNLAADPELRFTNSGTAVAGFTVISTPRVYDSAKGEWRDGDPLSMRCSVWREQAENVCQSLAKGARVIVTGRLKGRKYTDRDGQARYTTELKADEVGPSLRWATSELTRTSGAGIQRAATAASDNPWGSAPLGSGDLAAAGAAPF